MLSEANQGQTTVSLLDWHFELTRIWRVFLWSSRLARPRTPADHRGNLLLKVIAADLG